MPIDTKHEQYDKKSKIWKKCRDAIAGEEAIKAAGDVYLPKLGGQNEDEYNAYVMRASFFNASGRTHEGMLGTLFRVDPTINPEPPDSVLRTLAERTASELLEVGRCGLLADAPTGGGFPYITLYRTEDITNWWTVMDGDQEVILRVVLREAVTVPDQNDPYAVEVKENYRELYLDPESGVYMQQLWEQSKSGQWEMAGQPITPTAAGQVMNRIPFTFVSVGSTKSDVTDPPMLDLINVNLSHYRSSADLEHGRHFTALPTAWVAGFDTDADLVIGAGTAWVTGNVNAKAGFLEFTGQGLQALERAVEQKEKQMALLGTQLFLNGGAETATAAKIHRAQQTASLTTVAKSVTEAMTIAYSYLLLMNRANPTEVTFDLATDFMPETLDAQMVTTLVSTYQQGGMSLETLLWNFKQGELLPPDVTPDDEIGKIVAGLQRITTGGIEDGME